MDYIRKYERIVKQIVKKSFPELKNKKIKIVEFPNIISVTESFSVKGIRNYYLFINTGCRRRDNKSLKGQLCHELCHTTLDYLNKSFLVSFWYLIKKDLSAAFNTRFSREIETKTDKEVIKRGYARERYSLAINWKRIYSERTLRKVFYPRGYLTPQEIKTYAIKIRKW